MVFQLEKITFIYWLIECTPKVLFVRVFQFQKIIFIYWPIECTPKALLLGCFELKELPSFIGQLNALQKPYC